MSHVTSRAPVRVLHVITDLDIGGAETQLSRLVRAMPPSASHHLVVSMTAQVPLAGAIEAAGIEVRSLGLQRGALSMAPVFTLRRWIREWNPGLVETWMYHADLLGLLATRGRDMPPLVWNLRASHLDMSRYRRLSGLVRSTCARLSTLPAAVVANSEAGVRTHTALGYRPRQWKVIPNGIDTTEFCPDPDRREAVRHELGLPPEAFVVGVVARYDPMKGHDLLAATLERWLAADTSAHVVVAGAGVSWEAPEYAALAARLPRCRKQVHLVGVCRDVAALWTACDAGCSPSHGEGFANAIAEAMACAVPVIATAVGDSPRIVGNPALVFPSGDSAGLCDGLRQLAGLPDGDRRQLGRDARHRILEHFSLSAAVRSYSDLYRLLARPARSGSVEGISN